MMKKKITIITLLALLILAAGFLFLHESDAGEYKITSEKIFIKNSRDTYTLAEAVYPKNFDGPMPLVAVAHGFTGSIDSGGAKELCRSLAKRGIAAVRLDFDAYLNPDEKADRACEYTLQTMEEDMLYAIRFMMASYNIDQDRIGLYGRSMGGRVAMMMANESYGDIDYKAMALVAPAGNRDSMIYFMGGTESWEEMKKDARQKGYVSYKHLKLPYEWFTQFETYIPTDHGDRFGNHPVLVICNTLDYVVTDETSKECANAYQNNKILEVTTQDHHGYEMSFETSKLKDQLMDSIADHFQTNL